MGIYYTDNSYSIGKTPLVRLNKVIAKTSAVVLAKIEGRNPSYSVKCRIGSSMIWDAERKGLLHREKIIIEPTSGNTGIALAFVCAARGYKLVLTMPETMSIERRKLLQAFGAELILTEGPLGMKGAVKRAQSIYETNPGRYVLLQQFENPANPAIHEQTTGPEIWEDTNGKIDVLISGVGTGGTITGVSRFIKKIKLRPIISVAVEPAESPVLTQYLNNRQIQPGPHRIQGIGAGFVPKVLDLSLVDRVEQITSDEAFEFCRRLVHDEGILAGISSGAALAVTDRLIKKGEFEGKTIVVILPDSGERYLSTGVFEFSSHPLI